MKEFFEITSKKEIGQFHSIHLEYVEKYKNHQCFINFVTENAARRAVEYFSKFEMQNHLELKTEFRSSSLEKRKDSLPSEVNSGKNPLLKNQPPQPHQRENSQARKQGENSKRYIVIDGNNVAIQ